VVRPGYQPEPCSFTVSVVRRVVKTEDCLALGLAYVAAETRRGAGIAARQGYSGSERSRMSLIVMTNAMIMCAHGGQDMLIRSRPRSPSTAGASRAKERHSRDTDRRMHAAAQPRNQAVHGRHPDAAGPANARVLVLGPPGAHRHAYPDARRCAAAHDYDCRPG
jgi:hypothetical protein